MKIETKIQKWGNGLALRISGPMRNIPHFSEDMAVEVYVTEDGFTVKKCEHRKSKLPFSEEELLADITPESAHSDLLAQPLKNEIGD